MPDVIALLLAASATAFATGLGAIPVGLLFLVVARQLWAAVGTSSPQPVGALIAFLAVEEVSGLLPVSFAFAAGAMLALSLALGV